MRSLGFTLVELMVAITIMGIIVALSVNAFKGARSSSRDTERKTDVEDIRSSLEIYRADCSEYPDSEASWIYGLPFDQALTANCTGSVNTYMSKVPQDPYNVQKGYSYRYNKISDTQYMLCAYLENGTGSASNCGGSCGTSSGQSITCNYSVANP